MTEKKPDKPTPTPAEPQNVSGTVVRFISELQHQGLHDEPCETCGAGAGIPCQPTPRLRSIPMPGLEVGRALADILGSLRLNLNHSPWSRSRGVVGWVMQTVSETTETLMTLTPDKFGNRPTEMLVDPERLRAELGDVFWCWATAIYAAEDAGLFKMEDVLREAEAKLRRRKPWIFDAAHHQPNSPEEEHKMTLANKAKEKKL